MAYTTLNSLLTAIANAIRSKKGTTAQINAQNFPSEIASIETSVKSQTVNQTIVLTAGQVKTLTFTFNELTTVYGISNITRTKTSQAYGQYQDINGRYDNPHPYFSISGNTVVLQIQGYVDTTSEAQWSVTAVGK